MPAPTTASAHDDACYLALKAHDARFDGHFFTAVTSTGIYCRPVCRVRTPRRENCRFFTLAAQAESAGFRPCLRCRPELAPGQDARWSTQDATSTLARQAAHLMDTPLTQEPWTMETLAARLGVSGRHLRRIFEACWGVSPVQYWQTRRLLLAKQLLSDTSLPVAQVATLSGFASVRRFNAAFAQHYRMQPSALRKAQGTQGQGLGAIALRAAYRPPYDVAALLQFFATRSMEGLESVDLQQGSMVRSLGMEIDGSPCTGWVQIRFVPDACSVELRVAESLAGALPQVLARVRAWLDLDADPLAINAVLQTDFPGTEGLRLPGMLDGFELAVRAILGQQITVAAARTLGQRLVQRLGAPLATPFAAITHLFPSATVLATTPGEVLGELGIVRQRQAAITQLARAVCEGRLALQPGADVPATMQSLQAINGIGPWTAHYIAMRALRWPDAFPSGDVALHKALGVQGKPNPAKEAELASQRWRPWRSYAVVRAWNLL